MATLRKRYSPAIVWGIVAAAIGIFLFLYFRNTSGELVTVRVAQMTRQDLIRTVATNGKVEPIEEFQAHAPFPGVIQKIFVQAGQKVKTGDLLLTMGDADARTRVATATTSLRSAQVVNDDLARGGTVEEKIAMAADLKRGQLQIQQFERELAALQELQGKGAASASEVDSARERLEVARASLQQTQQRSNGRFSASERARAAAQLADSQSSLNAAVGAMGAINMRAPFAGTVYSLPVSQYDFVPGGEDLVDVADLNRLQVRAYFDEPEIGQLANGQAVTIEWNAKPNRTWHGHISHAPTTVITYNTRSVGECLISVDDGQSELLPNTNVTVTVTTSQRNDAPSLPREALHTEGLANFVYRVIDHKLVRTPVQIGVVNLNRVEITGGLTDKDVVALGATSNRDLSDGLEVRSAP